MTPGAITAPAAIKARRSGKAKGPRNAGPFQIV